ncbi:hypothetical protein [Elizabethkingia miricola]|uniref:hypothetical protein n=1 Tax=Elizabethkingia miricola TaxID=172045 RepID=UPI002019057E|nr:hypothetical protein [Elizabethkingia miricola]
MDKALIKAFEFIYLIGKSHGQKEATEKLLLHEIKSKHKAKEEYIHPFVSCMGISFFLVISLVTLVSILTHLKSLL